MKMNICLYTHDWDIVLDTRHWHIVADWTSVEKQKQKQNVRCNRPVEKWENKL